MGRLADQQPRGAAERMISVSVEVSSGSVRFRVEVRVESIEEEEVRLAAVSHPGSEVKLMSPIDPDTLFIEKSAPALGTVLPEVPELVTEDVSARCYRWVEAKNSPKAGPWRWEPMTHPDVGRYIILDGRL